MTQTGLSLGTPQYMSPEQAMGEKSIDARSDVYALGAVTYEMLTGDAPFTGSTVQAIVAKVLSVDPERPTLMRTTIPPHVEAALPTAIAIVAAVWGWMRPAPARPVARYDLGLPDSAQVVGSFAAHCAGALCFTRWRNRHQFVRDCVT